MVRRYPGSHDVSRGRSRIKSRYGQDTNILYDRYLVNRTGSSNKFYYTAVAENNGKFYPLGAYGRIGSLGDVFNILGGKNNPMASTSDMGRALRMVQEKENKKLKGKKDRNTGEMSRYGDFELDAEGWEQGFAKLMGAYPLPPNNQYAVGGFMDDGFEYAEYQSEEYGCDRCKEEVSDGNAYYPKATGSDDDTRICEVCYRKEPTFSIYQAEYIVVKCDSCGKETPKEKSNHQLSRLSAFADFEPAKGFRYCSRCDEHICDSCRAEGHKHFDRTGCESTLMISDKLAKKWMNAELEELDDTFVRVRNRLGDAVGSIEVDDADIEDVVVEISDDEGEIVEEVVLESEGATSFLKIVGATAAVFGVFGLLSRKLEKNAETLIENPDTGDLKPADYEEIVVQSTGYYVPIIPISLDGSFMGSRFHALPTDRLVYDDPKGIGAHIDVAMNRNYEFLPNEQALVMASEAPGQSPYNSMTGQENPDFAYRVIHETNPVSLDGSVAKFIPTDLSGYTGQQFVPTSVYEDMLGVGVSGQTPAFQMPYQNGDLGANRFGSRLATPDMLTNVNGPVQDTQNSGYTDGTTTLPLSEWSVSHQVQRISDTEAVVIMRGSGERKMIRRV